MGTDWAVILGSIGAGTGVAGVAVAAAAIRFTWVTSRQSIAVASTMAGIEHERRHAERIPKLTARLERWGSGSEDLLLAVWLESSEALAKLRVVVQEARNMDGPVGFKPGQDGVAMELPWPAKQDALEGLLPAWRADVLRPLADWPDRIAPGTAAVWQMQLRRTADMAGGCAAIRFKALCTADDGQAWEIAVPVTISDMARELIDTASKNSDR
jgi:hypothetical protein